MTIDISFYHLQRQTLSHVLPKLLEKALGAWLKTIIRAGDHEQLQHIDEELWRFTPDSFLPHGHAKTPYPERQQIYITTTDENPNNATLLMITGGGEAVNNFGDFTRCFDIFDGNSPDMVAAARARWSTYKNAGHKLTYWQQNERGGWDKKG